MNAEQIIACLSEENRDIKVITVKETTSTNDELKRLALGGERETVLFVAESQSAGKGRKGRSFFSPDRTGVYMSLLIHPSLTAEMCPLITPLCAVAVAEAIEKVAGIKTDIKWVNDLFVGGKKVAGILTEGAFTEKGADYIIVGIGINLAEPKKGFPEEIRDIAGFLIKGEDDLRSQLAAETVNIFMHRMKEIESRAFLDDYKKRLFFFGEEITVKAPEGDYKAVAEDIDSMCRLIVRSESGERKALGSGEISVGLK